MTTDKNISLQRILFLSLTGALLLGALWRFRGSHGWGGESGVFNAGFLFIMFLVAVCRGAHKATPLKTAFAGAAFILTTPAWGTLNKQICGVISNKDDPLIHGVPVYSAVLIMLLLGFTMCGIFALFTANIFSEKQWKLRNYIIIIGLFFAVQYLFKATLAHPLLRLIQPVSVNAFDGGLASENITQNVFRAYLAHFDNVSWAKKIPGGRNYFAEIELISRACAVVCCLLVTRFGFRDKQTAKLGAIICGAFAAGITVADLFFLFFTPEGKNIQSSFVSAWSCWEYFTGFIAGGIITAAVLKLGKTGTEPEHSLGFIPRKVHNILSFAIGLSVPVAFNILRPLILRLDGVKYQIPVSIVACLVTAVILILTGIKHKFAFSRVRTVRYSLAVLGTVFTIQTVVYFFIAGEYAAANDGFTLSNLMTAVSCAAVILFTLICAMKERKPD
ncbi:MAG: hypothetical protein K6F64_08200 [Clostridia bacterium]|nr:hypothetical protein [Clostridia bacterium]